MLEVLSYPSWVADLGIFVVNPILLRNSAHHLCSHLIGVSNLPICASESWLSDLLHPDPILLLLLIIDSLYRASHYLLLLGDAISIVGCSRLRLLAGRLRHGRGLLCKTLLPFFGSTLGRVCAVATISVAVARLVCLSDLGRLRGLSWGRGGRHVLLRELLEQGMS